MPLFAIAKSAGGAGVDIENEAEAFFRSDVFDRAGVFGSMGPRP
jgi:hypothetical protein